MVKRIIARFHDNVYSPEVWAEAGGGPLPNAAVLVHVFDGWEDQGSSGEAWRAKGDMSCSLLYADVKPRRGPNLAIPIFSAWGSGTQGLIFRPGRATRIKCGNAEDSSQGHCAGTWCPSVPLMADPYDPTDPREHAAAGCHGSWKPSDFGVFLHRTTKWNQQVQVNSRHQLDYNEIIVDGDHWTSHLPDAVEAFFTSEDLGRKEPEIARTAHRQFLRAFNLNADDVPLLWLDRWNWETPFKVVD